MLKKLQIKHVVIILAAVTLLGLLGFRVFQAVNSEAETGKGRGGTRVQTVEVGSVTRGAMEEKVTLTGPLKAKEEVEVNPKVSGRIVQIKVDTGQAVERGALLAVIEDAEIEQQVQRSKASIDVNDATISQREAELSNALAELNRKKQLMEMGLISHQEFETVETRYKVAQSQLELARAQRRATAAEERELTIRHGQTRVYSPINGIISVRHVDQGAMVSPTNPIVTVVNVSTMVLEANASEKDIARIRAGSQATVIVDSLPGQQYPGRVMRISPVLDPQTRNGSVEIEIANKGGALKGEMFARVELDLGTARETLFIPRDALVYRGDQPGVFTLEAETARFRPVETGLTQENRVEVTNGLKEGDTVVTGGANVIKDGDQVKVTNRPNEPQP